MLAVTAGRLKALLPQECTELDETEIDRIDAILEPAPKECGEGDEDPLLAADHISASIERLEMIEKEVLQWFCHDRPFSKQLAMS